MLSNACGAFPHRVATATRPRRTRRATSTGAIEPAPRSPGYMPGLELTELMAVTRNSILDLPAAAGAVHTRVASLRANPRRHFNWTAQRADGAGRIGPTSRATFRSRPRIPPGPPHWETQLVEEVGRCHHIRGRRRRSCTPIVLFVRTTPRPHSVAPIGHGSPSIDCAPQLRATFEHRRIAASVCLYFQRTRAHLPPSRGR